MALPDWTREPLVHFLAAGALLYVGLTAFGGEPVDPADRTIRVDAETQVRLAAQFEGTMNRAPTDAELDALIEAYVREEVLYREALRLGLDQGDTVVRQRLVSKMDQSASAAAEIAEPDASVLRSYFDANASKYGGEGLFTFDQAYFRQERDARAALSGGGAIEGEAISLTGSMSATTLAEVEARFGAQFASGLAQLDADAEWSGPIQSGFGWHLVRLTRYDTAKPEFEALRSRVLNDWRSEETARRRERAYTALRDAYRITVEQ